ncbi:MAG: T9SS type A sorting domain-containing protein [Bacteroidales bacterium]
MKHLLNILILLEIAPLLSSAQDSVFNKTYGQIGYNYGEKVIQKSDSGYIILGNKSGFVGNTDVYIVRTNNTGNIVWDKAYGGSEVNWAEDIKPTADGGYIITGYMNIPDNNDYNIMLLKTDSGGNTEWLKNYGGSNWDFGHSVVETADSGFIVAGETYSFGNGNNDVFLLKTDKNGDSLWSKFYGGSNTDIAYDVSVCHDGNFIITGYTNSFGKGGYDAYLLKITSSGDTLWTRTYGDTLDDKTFSGIETQDHGIVLTGSTMTFNAMAQDGVIFKADSAGNFLWAGVIGGIYNEEFYDILQNSDESLFMAGYTESYGSKDFYMVKTDKDGWYNFGPTSGGDKTDIAKSCIPTSDGGYAIIGTTERWGPGISNILLIKTNSVGYLDTSYSYITGIDEHSIRNFSIYPNPVSDNLHINIPEERLLSDIVVYNYLCQVVSKTKPADGHVTNIDFSGFPEGIYIISLHFNETIINQKVIHIR